MIPELTRGALILPPDKVVVVYECLTLSPSAAVVLNSLSMGVVLFRHPVCIMSFSYGLRLIMNTRMV